MNIALNIAKQWVEAAALLILAIVVVTGANLQGRRAQATKDSLEAGRVLDSALAAHTQRLQDSLKKVEAQAAAMILAQRQFDSTRAARHEQAAVLIARAAAIRQRATIDSASVVIQGLTLQVPPLVATAWASERSAAQAAIAGLQASERADSLALAARDQRLQNDSVQIAVRDSIIDSKSREIAARDDQIKTLARRHSGFGFVGGVVTGALGVLVIALAHL